MKYSYIHKHGWESQKQCQKKSQKNKIQHDTITIKVQKQENLSNILGVHMWTVEP